LIGFKGFFVNYYTKRELKELFEEFFEILLVVVYAEFESGVSLLLIAKKK
jgi:hypothetical protein